MLPPTTLIFGGERSGKSDRALELVTSESGMVHFLATGQPADLAFRHQILVHRRERSPEIGVREVGRDLVPALEGLLARACDGRLDGDGSAPDIVLADSLDFWLFLIDGPELEEQVETLCTVVDSWNRSFLAGEHTARLVFVSCEVGLGPIAATSQTRKYVRQLGGLNRTLARLCHRVELSVAGLPLVLKEL